MSIKEIAELAGVSKATVSLALNGRKGVAHDTRMKVLKIAEGMGYRVPSKRIVVTRVSALLCLPAFVNTV